MKKSILALIVLALNLSLASCKKGEQGPAGPQGEPGKNGAANITSMTYSMTSTNWFYNSTDKVYEADMYLPQLTQSIYDAGIVMVYIKDSGNNWIALPFSYGSVQYNFRYKISYITAFAGLSSLATPGNPGSQVFKVVVIPPGMVKPEIDIKNHNDAMQAYGLN